MQSPLPGGMTTRASATMRLLPEMPMPSFRRARMPNPGSLTARELLLGRKQSMRRDTLITQSGEGGADITVEAASNQPHSLTATPPLAYLSQR